MPINPLIIEAAAKNAGIKEPLKKIEPGNASLLSLDVIKDNIPIKLQQLLEDINTLQKNDFDYESTDNNDRTVLIKNNINKSEDTLNPISPHEAHIQALRYTRGMLLIIENAFALFPHEINAALSEINTLFTEFQTDLEKIKTLRKPNMNTDDYFKELYQQQFLATNRLACQYARTINTTLKSSLLKSGLTDEQNLKYALTQLSMAKDLGLLLENPKVVCTASSTTNEITFEKSTLIKISSAFYDQEIGKNPKEKLWFDNAIKFGGIQQTADQSWLELFFKNNLNALKELGIPVFSTMRWMPLPANNQEIEIHVTPINRDETSVAPGTTSHFVRMGVSTPLEIQNLDEQERLGVAQIKEIIQRLLDSRINAFKILYGIKDGDKFTFYCDYQTLLTPISGTELAIKSAAIDKLFKDNNAKFVVFAKTAIEQIAADYREHSTPSDVTLKFVHTNAPINYLADNKSKEPVMIAIAPLIPGDHSGETDSRREKVEETRKLIFTYLQTAESGNRDNDYHNAIALLTRKRHNSPLSPIQNELLLRLRAARMLEALLDNKSPYNELPKYQRNIMMAALEFHTLGSQALSLIGCKSARDRTAVFLSAVKTMQEDPQAMEDWVVLNKGIIKSLHQGHAFRSMIFHAAIAKISDVHKDLANQLNQTVQAGIKSLKPLTKRLKVSKEHSSLFQDDPRSPQKKKRTIATLINAFRSRN